GEGGGGQAAGHRVGQRVVDRVQHHERRDARLRLGGVEPLRGQRDVGGEGQLPLGGGDAGGEGPRQRDGEQRGGGAPHARAPTAPSVRGVIAPVARSPGRAGRGWFRVSALRAGPDIA